MSETRAATPIASRFRGFLPVVVDVETGGFNARTDALLEIAAVLLQIDGEGRWSPFETHAAHVEPFPGANVEPAALEFNGIRLDHPLRRRADGRFERVSWDDAIAEIAERLSAVRERSGPEAVSAYVGNPTAFNTFAGPALASFFGQLGVRRSFGSGTQDCANKFAAGEAVYGSSTIHPVPDLEHSDHILIFGENPRVSHMSFLSIPDPVGVLRAARERGEAGWRELRRHQGSAERSAQLVVGALGGL